MRDKFSRVFLCIKKLMSLGQLFQLKVLEVKIFIFIITSRDYKCSDFLQEEDNEWREIEP